MLDNSENNLYIIELDEGLHSSGRSGKNSSNGITKVIAFGILALSFFVMILLDNLFSISIIIVATIVSFFVIGLICAMKNNKTAFALLIIISILLFALATFTAINCNDDIKYALKMYELTQQLNANARQLANVKGTGYSKIYSYDYNGKEELTLCVTFYLTSIVCFITSFIKLKSKKDK